MTHNIMQMIVLSTGHLAWSTVQLLEHTPILSERYPVMGAPIPYGFLVYAHDEEEGIPADLWACCVYARKHGCDYIRFDAEEDVCDALPDHTATHRAADAPADTSSDDEDACRDCGAPLDEAGDGYDGRCPSCADRADVSA